MIIPEGVTRIGSIAFHGYTSLTSVTIPASVTSIGWHAFGGCKNLRHVRGLKRHMEVDSDAFYGSLWKAKKIQREVPIRVLIVLAILSAIVFGGAAIASAIFNLNFSDAILGCTGVLLTTFFFVMIVVVAIES